MGRRRGATGLSGVLVIDKPAGMTSHDVVAAVRRATGEGRVGHAGTLDPMATGLLVVLVGPYTRLEPFLSCAGKRYDATILFGAETDTDDAEGAIVRTADVPAEALDPGFAASVLARFTGALSQRPPAYSAIKVDGTTAHRAARAGAALELAERAVVVHEATLAAIVADPPSWQVSFFVSKGTYIRALARDIGAAIGSAGHLGALRRTASGTLSLDGSTALADVVAAEDVTTLFVDPLVALGLPVVDAPLASVSNGLAISRELPPEIPDGSLVSVVSEAALAAVYEVRGERLVPRAVFPRSAQA